MNESWHRHLGVYGICINDGKLLVIHKNGGPYINRFDLPGGTVEPNESLIQSIHREFAEETGIKIQVIRNMGNCDYLVPYELEHRNTTHIHHVAIFYEVKYIDGNLEFDQSMLDNDSKGVEWICMDSLYNDNSSPLVMTAVEWINSGSLPPLDICQLDDWEVK